MCPLQIFVYDPISSERVDSELKMNDVENIKSQRTIDCCFGLVSEDDLRWNKTETIMPTSTTIHYSPRAAALAPHHLAI
jgi:hypothetical protein